MNTKPNAQAKMIAAHLKAGNTITALEALQKFGCLRLAARIADLRKVGLNADTRCADPATNATGKTAQRSSQTASTMIFSTV